MCWKIFRQNHQRTENAPIATRQTKTRQIKTIEVQDGGRRLHFRLSNGFEATTDRTKIIVLCTTFFVFTFHLIFFDMVNLPKRCSYHTKTSVSIPYQKFILHYWVSWLFKNTDRSIKNFWNLYFQITFRGNLFEKPSVLYNPVLM